jgi:peptidoglycan/xylan/chitin deacetylase (PgdA/CDA1 family)
MKKLVKHGSVILILLGALFSTAAYMHRDDPRPGATLETLYLLVPDSADAGDPSVHEWLDAAEEEGLHLEIVRDSTLLNPMSQFQAAGLIVPDKIHRIANDTLIAALHEYVHRGGRLMLVYDACTWDLNGHFPKFASRLSDLIGVGYAMYDEFGRNTMEQSRVWGNERAMEKLGIPPGKYVPMGSLTPPASLHPAAMKGAKTDVDKENPSPERRFTLSRYLYNDLKYPSFHTSGKLDGEVLLQSEAGLVAGRRKHGSGEVLFVNLPLGYLKSRTDGLLLHSFLHYFAIDMLHLPFLATVPDGVGGLVLNWHIDDAKSLKRVAMLDKAGIFEQGPFSFHFTAGPDVDTFNDGKGMDLEHNPEAQNWVRSFMARGDAIGSHGGWIHNYFGENLNDDNERDFERYLLLNRKALENVMGGPVKEYSAPLGNHPQWVTRWLEQHGYNSYYFAGDSGMGPTHVYRDNGRDGSSIWGFPILHLGIEASLEEMSIDKVPESTVQSWLLSITDYTAGSHVARLVYSHPLGATIYIPALQTWMRHAKELAHQGDFRWYTMGGIADFLNKRSGVQWTLVSRPGEKQILEASHPKSLEHQAWMFPASRYRHLRATHGTATIRSADNWWIVTAGNCKQLTIELD